MEESDSWRRTFERKTHKCRPKVLLIVTFCHLVTGLFLCVFFWPLTFVFILIYGASYLELRRFVVT